MNKILKRKTLKELEKGNITPNQFYVKVNEKEVLFTIENNQWKVITSPDLFDDEEEEPEEKEEEKDKDIKKDSTNDKIKWENQQIQKLAKQNEKIDNKIKNNKYSLNDINKAESNLKKIKQHLNNIEKYKKDLKINKNKNIKNEFKNITKASKEVFDLKDKFKFLKEKFNKEMKSMNFKRHFKTILKSKENLLNLIQEKSKSKWINNLFEFLKNPRQRITKFAINQLFKLGTKLASSESAASLQAAEDTLELLAELLV